jgi:hypothetical protein
MFNKLIRGEQADKELSVSRLPRLLLQLHALTDNPMNITVTGNITVSVELEVIVPTEETFLINKRAEENSNLYEEVSVTIPDGVTVLYISSYAQSSETYDDYVTVEITNLSNKKMWLYRSENISFYDQWYVGVTPNKTYNLSLYIGADYNLDGGYIKISYSQSINQKIPDVTDY